MAPVKKGQAEDHMLEQFEQFSNNLLLNWLSNALSQSKKGVGLWLSAKALSLSSIPKSLGPKDSGFLWGSGNCLHTFSCWSTLDLYFVFFNLCTRSWTQDLALAWQALVLLSYLLGLPLWTFSKAQLQVPGRCGLLGVKLQFHFRSSAGESELSHTVLAAWDSVTPHHTILPEIDAGLHQPAYVLHC